MSELGEEKKTDSDENAQEELAPNTEQDLEEWIMRNASNSKFYEDIANVIAKLAISPPEGRSQIIGITGSWGTGKSSVLSMIFEIAKQEGIPSNHLICFNAWATNTDDLIEEFFRELAKGLKVAVNNITIQSLTRYADMLTSAGKLAEKLLNALSRITTILGLIGIGLISLVESVMVRLILLATAIAVHTAGPLLFGTGWALGAMHKILERYQGKRNSLTAVRSRVNDRLSELDKPLIIAIDDIDRVRLEKGRDILDLIKNNARFSNLTYIILLDDRCASLILGEGDESRGADLLSKYFDISISLDSIEKT